MITAIEIRGFARRNGVPETTIERDYAQNWLLAGLSKTSLKMALKGGTGIRKAYIENYRFSDDIDFTLTEKVEPDNIKNEINKAVKEAKREIGINFAEKIRLNEFKNGYMVVIYFRILRRTGYPLRIKIDITKKENEIIILPLENRKIIHPYSDNCNSEVLTYSFKEIFAEKIRSLFQRTRPRDLYDVWCLSKQRLDISEVINEKFRFKGINADFNNLLNRKEEFRNAWENSLRHQLKELPSYDEVFAGVLCFLDVTGIQSS
ncbi:MAG: nucleotidyl transferase AbiEii/AbiGii toxin family protein [Candidatus Helarchaeota archaeon]